MPPDIVEITQLGASSSVVNCCALLEVSRSKVAWVSSAQKGHVCVRECVFVTLMIACLLTAVVFVYLSRVVCVYKTCQVNYEKMNVASPAEND